MLFVFAVVATPPTVPLAFVGYGACLYAVALLAGVPLRFVARRLLFEMPFLLFALALPFLAAGDRVSVLGHSLSVNGLWGAWNIGSKATLGFASAILLAATTPVADILYGLERLHAPRVLTSIAHFMIRYADVITGEMRRMQIARESRGYEPRWLGHVRALAASLGSLFLRSYERGERVYLAMVSRGYAGSIPVVADHGAGARAWITALSLPAAAAVIAGLAWAAR
jgi:cobalt/nickel transport system permease protein